MSGVTIDDASLGTATMTTESMSYKTRPVFTAYFSDVEKLVASGADTSDTKLLVRLSWKIGEKSYYQDCSFPDYQTVSASKDGVV